LLQDLEGFDRIWLISFMHLNGVFGRPTVRPPRGGAKRGLLATRAPHRPNPIALSCVELLGVEGRVISVKGLDLLNDTPILDIKPYIGRFDAFPDSSVGWLEGLL
jgi:tRNA-Thr(GGU) m(6)t(6)A37 methyltransferase TsaA